MAEKMAERVRELEAQLESERALHMGQLEKAWHVIANAHRGGAGWADAPADWRADAMEFRERIWLPALRARDAATGLCKVCGRVPGYGHLRGLCDICHIQGRVAFVMAGGEFTGRDESAFAAAQRVAASSREITIRRREVVARGWLAVQGVASFLALYPDIYARGARDKETR